MQVLIRYYSFRRKAKPGWFSLFVFLGVLANDAAGQVLHIGFSVPAEFVATGFIRPETVLWTLNHNGTQTELASNRSGRLTIKTMENTMLVVSADSPDNLISETGERIPLSLDMFWLNTGGRDKTNARHLKDPPAGVQMNKSNYLFDRISVEQNFLRAFLFINVSAYTGDASPGIYQGTVKFVLEYY